MNASTLIRYDDVGFFQRASTKRSSLKNIVYRSLRLPRRNKSELEDTRRCTLDSRGSTTSSRCERVQRSRPTSAYLLTHASSSNLRSCTVPEEPAPVFRSLSNMYHTGNCCLVPYITRENAAKYDRNCRLASWERKKRCQQLFGADHGAKEQLFCPEQASQVELEFQSHCTKDLLVQVIAPNGESSILHAARESTIVFSPTKVGCGHGEWIFLIAVRRGCRFKHVYTKTITLRGQGSLLFHIDQDVRLRLADRLWLGVIN